MSLCSSSVRAVHGDPGECFLCLLLLFFMFLMMGSLKLEESKMTLFCDVRCVLNFDDGNLKRMCFDESMSSMYF